MKRRILLLVALPLVLAAVALVSIRVFGGSTEPASAQEPQLGIDMVKDGSTWCNPVDSSATHTSAEGDYQVAVCLINSTVPAAAFDITILYDNSLNACSSTAQSGKGLDMNPDFIGDATAPSSAWDCSGNGQLYPSCGSGAASLSCITSNDPGTITSGRWPIAVITFHVVAPGEDDLSFSATDAYSYSGDVTLPTCPEDGPDVCLRATDTKESGNTPVPTATSTTVPTATATRTCGGVGQEPCPTSTPTSKPWTVTPTAGPTNTPAPSGGGGGGGEAVPTVPPVPSGGGQPAVVPPNTGTGPSGVPWAATLMWALGSCAALSLIAGGLYLRRVRNR